ncbi:MAG: transposase [Cyanobacteria bacterium P01_F01_bin.143]
MKQKTAPEKLVSALLQTIDPKEIADEQMRQTVELLLNLIEQLNSKVIELEAQTQKLRDENNRLKGEQGKPDIKANKKKGLKKEYSSEKERKKSKNHRKTSKKKQIKIDRSEIVKYPREKLPEDAEFKGYEEVIVQDIVLKTDNVLFRKQKFYSPQTGKTYLASLPGGYEGEFGPGIKALVTSLYYSGNMTQGKIRSLLEDLGISISAGYLSNLLIKNPGDFETEFNELYKEGLATSPWQHLDQTGARVGGVNYTTNIICNPLYTVYQTTRNKDRLSVLRILQNTQELELILNELTYELLGKLKLPIKWQNRLQLLPQETVLTQTQFNALLEQHLEKLSSGYRTRIQEAAAIAFYHQQSNWPVVRTLVCDDAPQFKLISEELALCWVHEGRHYKKLNPLVAYHQQLLQQFLKDFWDYYRELLAYTDASSPQAAEKLRTEFYRLFDSDSGYQQLDERKRLTFAKISELLLVLEHPELPLHNNPAELGARTMVQRRNISYGTQTLEGTKAWDIFMSLVATTRKLGISFFEYMRDRISQVGNIPSLATIIREQSSLYSFGGSWTPE